jgi:proteic killer suppression protein
MRILFDLNGAAKIASACRNISGDTLSGPSILSIVTPPPCFAKGISFATLHFRVDKCKLTLYSWVMIGSFKHKGLRNLFEQDDARKVKADQVDRLRLILSALDQAADVQDMNQPTFRLHPLKGNRKGVWAVTVRANWRVTFRFEAGDASDVDLEDYH